MKLLKGKRLKPVLLEVHVQVYVVTERKAVVYSTVLQCMHCEFAAARYAGKDNRKVLTFGERYSLLSVRVETEVRSECLGAAGAMLG